MPNPTVPAAAPGLPTPVLADQGALVESLYRICGLVEAIFAISESEASEQIRESALDGVQRALKREAEDLLHAEEVGELVVSARPPFALRRGGRPAAPVPDPVFAILEEWRRLNAAHLAAIKETDRLVTSDAAEEAQTSACLAVGKFEREVLLEARPTTPAGAVALLQALAEWIDEIKDAQCAPAILAAAAVLEREARR